jgi:TetR/AcrR family transcriptional regulator, transcriptional repressor for nem operon
MNTRTQRDVRERILREACRLMLSKGYTATTVDEICVAAGVTKGSFFHYFASKERLGEEALDGFFRMLDGHFSNGAFMSQPDPLERVFGYLRNIVDLSSSGAIPKSCLIGNFAQELSDIKPNMRERCSRYFDGWIGGFTSLLDAAAERYGIAGKIDARSIGEYLVSVLEGTLVVYKAQRDENLLERNITHFMAYLKGVFQAHAATKQSVEGRS